MLVSNFLVVFSTSYIATAVATFCTACNHVTKERFTKIKNANEKMIDLTSTTWFVLDSKVSHVTPIYKKGNHSIADNYHPISLTSPVVRILESIIKDSVTHHMLINNIFSPSQHGFIPCTTQLLIAIDYWTQSLDDGYPVDVIYLDFHNPS